MPVEPIIPFLSGSSPLDEERWSDIAQDILSGNAIIFLGPGATVNYDDAEFQASFFQELAVANPLRVSDFHKTDGLLVFRPKGRDRLSSYISDFFRQIPPNPMLELLSELPFHIYITLSPDLALRTAFERKGFEYEFAYNDRAPARDLPWPSPERPLLYSLLGSADEGKESSLVVSHGDIFELIESIHLRDSLPESLLGSFSVKPDRSKTILFLGIEYDRWYFHFLIHLFQLNGDLNPVAAAGDFPAGFHMALYEAYFKVTFVHERLMDFVSELSRRIPKVRTRSHQMQGCRGLDLVLFECLSDDELRNLCQQHFTVVYQEFTAGQSKSQRVRLLLDQVMEDGLCEQLNALLRDINPLCYQRIMGRNAG